MRHSRKIFELVFSCFVLFELFSNIDCAKPMLNSSNSNTTHQTRGKMRKQDHLKKDGLRKASK